jgi:hypothetical protein
MAERGVARLRKLLCRRGLLCKRDLSSAGREGQAEAQTVKVLTIVGRLCLFFDS